MRKRLARFRAPAWAGLTLVGTVAVLTLSVPAGAAAATTPESATNCGGHLSRGTASVDDPHAVNYEFNCDYSISAYTLVVDRGLNGDSTVDDFSSNATVLDPSQNPISTVAFSCSGTLPGNGVNCNGGGGSLPAPDFVQGSLDTSDPYCANVPAGSPAGTAPEPTATVQLVVTDTTGAEDGPFRLRLNGSCPKLHVVKPKGSGKHKTKPKPKVKTKS